MESLFRKKQKRHSIFFFFGFFLQFSPIPRNVPNSWVCRSERSSCNNSHLTPPATKGGRGVESISERPTTVQVCSFKTFSSTLQFMAWNVASTVGSSQDNDLIIKPIRNSLQLFFLFIERLGDERKKKHAVRSACILKTRMFSKGQLSFVSLPHLHSLPSHPGSGRDVRPVDTLEVGYACKSGWDLGYQHCKPKSLRGGKSSMLETSGEGAGGKQSYRSLTEGRTQN